ncbi:hypothetical protein HG438_002185 [Candidatus Saccharibacteria bacterium]|jgi:hypothetical protein|nr:hypothetical protein [Candidatus Saccharibacteria bacterium]
MKNGNADLKTVRVIRQNHRFAVSEVDWLGERVFCKQSQSGVTGKDEILRKASGLRTFDKLTRNFNDIPFSVPKLLHYDDMKILTQFIDGWTPELADVPDDFFVQSFVQMDRYFRSQKRRRSRWSQQNKGGEYIWQKLERIISGFNLEAIPPEIFRASLEFLRDNHSLCEARPMHADFTENNLLYDGDRYWLVDFESFRDDWPRWYDVVNFTYNREMERPETAERMRNIRRLVIERLGEEPTTQREIACIKIVRGLSLIIEHMTLGGRNHAAIVPLDNALRQRIITSFTKLLPAR